MRVPDAQPLLDAGGEAGAREAAVVRAVADMAGWTGPGPMNGRARGIAVATTGGWHMGGLREDAVIAVGVMALTIIGGSPASTAGRVSTIRFTFLACRACTAEKTRVKFTRMPLSASRY